MKVFLTGGTGLIGSSVLKNLVTKGHTVTALVRSSEAATEVEQVGVTALQGDINDTEWLAGQLANFDAAIHTATPRNDSNSPQVMDESIAKAVVNAFSGTDKRYIHTGGIWVHGSGEDITEETPANPPELTAWRRDVESIVMSHEGLNAILVEPGVVYGHGGGLPALIATTPQLEDGGLALIGDGSTHWTTIHADDVGALYVAVLEKGEAQNTYLGVSGENPTLLELTQAVSKARGISAQPSAEPIEKTKARLYGPLVDALLLDQQAHGQKARSLGWEPTQPSLLDQLAAGYADQS